MISSHDLSWPLILFFWNGNLYKYLFSQCFQVTRFSKTALLQATDEFLIFRANVELKSFGFSCVVALVSYFHFEMFGTMADIFLLVVLFLLAFAICVFSLCIFCQPILAVFNFAFSNKIIILHLYRKFLIKMIVL